MHLYLSARGKGPANAVYALNSESAIELLETGCVSRISFCSDWPQADEEGHMAALALASYLKTAVADARLPWVEWHLQVSNLALHRQLTAVLRQMDEICRQRGQEPPFDTAQGLAAGLNPDFTFERFVVGEENEQAYAQAVIAGLGGPKNNVPLLIYGDCGLGKTHLLHAVGWKYQTINPEKRVVLLHGTEFADLATCDATLKTVDALLIDDFHSLLHFLDAAKRHTLLASLPLLAVTAGQMDWRQVIQSRPQKFGQKDK